MHRTVLGIIFTRNSSVEFITWLTLNNFCIHCTRRAFSTQRCCVHCINENSSLTVSPWHLICLVQLNYVTAVKIKLEFSHEWEGHLPVTIQEMFRCDFFVAGRWTWSIYGRTRNESGFRLILPVRTLNFKGGSSRPGGWRGRRMILQFWMRQIDEMSNQRRQTSFLVPHKQFNFKTLKNSQKNFGSKFEKKRARGTISPKCFVWFWSRWKAPPYGAIHWPPPCCTTRTGQYLLNWVRTPKFFYSIFFSIFGTKLFGWIFMLWPLDMFDRN